MASYSIAKPLACNLRVGDRVIREDEVYEIMTIRTIDDITYYTGTTWDDRWGAFMVRADDVVSAFLMDRI